MYSFFELWTLKERYLKALGNGLLLTPLNSVKSDSSNKNIQIYNNNGDCDYLLRKYYTNSIFSITKTNKFPVTITNINFFDILEYQYFK